MSLCAHAAKVLWLSQELLIEFSLAESPLSRLCRRSPRTKDGGSASDRD